jgi:hypothetical protein
MAFLWQTKKALKPGFQGLLAKPNLFRPLAFTKGELRRDTRRSSLQKHAAAPDGQPVGCSRSAASGYHYTLDHLLSLEPPREPMRTNSPAASSSPSRHVNANPYDYLSGLTLAVQAHSSAAIEKHRTRLAEMASRRQNI